MKILMKHIQACYLVILLSWCYAATTAGRKSGSKSSTGQTKSNVDGDDVHHGQGSFVKPHLKKPLIPGLVGDKENSPTNTTVDPVQQQVYRAEIIDRTSISHSIESGGSLLEYVTPLCSPRAYRVHLKNGNCLSVVHTQVHLVSCMYSARIELFLSYSARCVTDSARASFIHSQWSFWKQEMPRMA